MNWSVNWFRVLMGLFYGVLFLALFCLMTYQDGIQVSAGFFGFFSGIGGSVALIAWLMRTRYGKWVSSILLLLALALFIFLAGTKAILVIGTVIVLFALIIGIVFVGVMLDHKAKAHDDRIANQPPPRKDEVT